MNLNLSQIPQRVRKWIAALAVMVFLITFGFSFNALFASRNYRLSEKAHPQTSPVGQQTPIPTRAASKTSLVSESEWRIYTNQTQGYSIKYPEVWNVYPEILGGENQLYRGTLFTSFKYNYEPNQIGRGLAIPHGEAAITIALGERNKQAEETLVNYLRDLTTPPGRLLVDSQKVNIQGLEEHAAIKVRDEMGYMIHVENRKRVYHIFLPFSNANRHQQTIETILSTLTFRD